MGLGKIWGNMTHAWQAGKKLFVQTDDRESKKLIEQYAPLIGWGTNCNLWLFAVSKSDLTCLKKSIEIQCE